MYSIGLCIIDNALFSQMPQSEEAIRIDTAESHAEELKVLRAISYWWLGNLWILLVWNRRRHDHYIHLPPKFPLGKKWMTSEALQTRPPYPELAVKLMISSRRPVSLSTCTRTCTKGYLTVNCCILNVGPEIVTVEALRPSSAAIRNLSPPQDCYIIKSKASGINCYRQYTPQIQTCSVWLQFLMWSVPSSPRTA